jgi:hypothetical protein
MSRKKSIPDGVRTQVIARVEAFNQTNMQPAKPSSLAELLQMFGLRSLEAKSLPVGSYVPRVRGAFLYLDRVGVNGRPFEVCPLKWTGNMENWEFAIYRHSRNFYDPDEWLFPGAGEIDGTAEGAMRAGMEAYPL